VRSSLCIT